MTNNTKQKRILYTAIGVVGVVGVVSAIAIPLALKNDSGESGTTLPEGAEADKVRNAAANIVDWIDTQEDTLENTILYNVNKTESKIVLTFKSSLKSTSAESPATLDAVIIRNIISTVTFVKNTAGSFEVKTATINNNIVEEDAITAAEANLNTAINNVSTAFDEFEESNKPVDTNPDTTFTPHWDISLPTSPLFEISPDEYTTDKTKASDYSGGTVGTLPSSSPAGVNVIIDGKTYTSAAGVYSLPAGTTEPTHKIGTDYYTTLDLAIDAAGYTTVTSGSTDGTNYSTENQPQIDDDNWAAATTGYFKGTEYVADKPQIDDVSYIEINSSITLGAAPTNGVFALDPATGTITDVADVAGLIDVTAEATNDSALIGQWILETATDISSLLPVQPKTDEGGWDDATTGFINGDEYSPTMPKVDDTSYNEVTSGYINSSNNLYYPDSSAVEAAATIEAAGAITYSDATINIDGADVQPVTSIAFPAHPTGPYYVKGTEFVTDETQADSYSSNPVTIQDPTADKTITIDGTTYTYVFTNPDAAATSHSYATTDLY